MGVRSRYLGMEMRLIVGLQLQMYGKAGGRIGCLSMHSYVITSLIDTGSVRPTTFRSFIGAVLGSFTVLGECPPSSPPTGK